MVDKWGHRTKHSGNSREVGTSLHSTTLTAEVLIVAISRNPDKGSAADSSRVHSPVSTLDNVCFLQHPDSCVAEVLLYYRTPSASQPKAASLLGIHSRHPHHKPRTHAHTHTLSFQHGGMWLISFHPSLLFTQTHKHIRLTETSLWQRGEIRENKEGPDEVNEMFRGHRFCFPSHYWGHLFSIN